MNKFPCSSCGACCKRIIKAVQNLGNQQKESPLHFPHKWNEQGVCEKLTTDNKCSIYETRPLICNVDEIAKLTNMPIKQFYNINIKACNAIMDEDNIPQEFRIKQI